MIKKINNKFHRAYRDSVVLAFSITLLLIIFSGCTASTRGLFFDGADKKPAPPTTRVRRDLLREIDDLKRQLAETNKALENAKLEAKNKKDNKTVPKAEQAKTWPELETILPKSGNGDVDWIAALKTDVMAPRVALDSRSPAQPEFDLDVVFNRSQSKVFGGLDSFAVTYRHSTHTQWLTCNNCHPAIFPLDLKNNDNGQRPRAVITMAKIKQGEYCGACHGKVAFAVDNACGRCHQGGPKQTKWQPKEPPANPVEQSTTWSEAEKLLPHKFGTTDWSKALADGTIAPRGKTSEKSSDPGKLLKMDLKLIPEKFPPMAVLFPHEAHTQWLTCENCHSTIFKKKLGATPMKMKEILNGKYCGVCHGKVAFPITDNCRRCHTEISGD